MKSLHIIGSKEVAGAERFFLRLIGALHERQQTVYALTRVKSAVSKSLPKGIGKVELPLRTVWDPISKFEVRRTIDAVKPDIVQTYMGRATRLTHLRPGRGPVHIARLGGYYKLKGYRHAHAWVGNTRGVCDYLIRNGFPANRVYYIYNFIDLPEKSTKDRLDGLRSTIPAPDEAFLLLAVGRLVPVKGIDVLLQAFARLPAEIGCRPVWLVIAGDGLLRRAMEERAAGLGISDRVYWAGWQKEPGGFYELADLVVFPSLERETFGNVILEAWAYRRPLVTSTSRGGMELTKHGEDAWQVPCGDVRALAEGMREMLLNEGLRRELVEKGYQKVRDRFSRKTVIDAYLTLYQEVIRKKI